MESAASAGGFGGPVRLVWVEGVGRRGGTYGMVEGCRDFWAMVVRSPVDVRAALEAGYRVEGGVLEATAAGLGSCWLGGTLDRGWFGEGAGCAEDERVLAVVAVGFPRGEGWRDGLVRGLVGASRRKGPEELFFEEDGRTVLRCVGWEAEALEAVRWAPSAGNRQPWRVVRYGSSYAFYLAVDGFYAAVYPWMQWMDIGIACRHWALVAQERGVEGVWGERPPPVEGRRWIPVVMWTR